MLLDEVEVIQDVQEAVGSEDSAVALPEAVEPVDVGDMYAFVEDIQYVVPISCYA